MEVRISWTRRNPVVFALVALATELLELATTVTFESVAQSDVAHWAWTGLIPAVVRVGRETVICAGRRGLLQRLS